MKKFLLCSTVFFFILGSVSFAQVSFGVKAGVNIANINGDNAGNTDSKTGLVVGGLMMYRFSNMFALQPEVLFSMQGASSEEGGIDTDLSLNYIQIPVLVKLLIPIEGSSPITPAIFVGPAFGLNMSADLEQSNGQQTQNSDIKDNVKTLDFGLAFGASLGFPVGSNELGVDVRYTLGLTSFSDVSGQDLDLKNSAIALTAYFIF